MSKIFDLINELCPEGVKFDELGVICKSLAKGTLKQEDLVDKGAYPVVNSSRDYYGFYDKYNNEANAFTIASRGEYAGFVKFIDCKFWAGGLCYPYTSKDEEYVLTKFIFYFLKSIEKKNMDILVARGSIPALNKSDFDKVKIPLPPMEVQREIVRILDSFTLLTEELTEELTARKKQYEFYRDFLLSFDELDKNGGGCELKMLGDIGEVRMCKRILKEQTSVNGEVPFYKIGTFGKEADAYISKELFDEYRSKYSYPKIGEVLISASGTIGRAVIFNGNDAYFQDSNIVWIENDEGQVLNRYLFYFYQIADWNIAEGGTIKRLYNDNLKKIKIPVPSLQTQQKVVDILDKFDTLVNSITEGLPREIELRRKQYEHYRELLLNFKPKMTA